MAAIRNKLSGMRMGSWESWIPATLAVGTRTNYHYFQICHVSANTGETATVVLSSFCAATISYKYRYRSDQQAIGPHEDLLTIVKRRKLQWYGHVSRSSGPAKTILQGTVKGGRRQGGQRKTWEDNIREWTGLEFGKSQRAVENREKWRKLVAKSSVVPQRPSWLRD